jgi:hypothetical protein
VPLVEDQLGKQRAYLLKRYPAGTPIGDDIRRMPAVAGSLTGIGGKGGFKDISPLLVMKKASQMGNHPKISIALEQAQWIRNELHDWITSYSKRETSAGMGFERFKQHWRVYRVWCPLQMRLACEEIFWELGDPYKRLITGFAPLK